MKPLRYLLRTKQVLSRAATRIDADNTKTPEEKVKAHVEAIRAEINYEFYIKREIWGEDPYGTAPDGD